MNPKSFVDRQASECVIPPNSFALARTVESEGRYAAKGVEWMRD